MMKNLVLTLTILIAACTSVEPIMGPDGSENQLIKSGNVESCYKKAREVCEGNYKIINTSSEKMGDSIIVSLLVKCDNSSGRK